MRKNGARADPSPDTNNRAAPCANRNPPHCFGSCMNDQLQELAQLLERRTSVIADHEFRDRDPDAHLQQLKEVSEAIMELHSQVKPSIDARLNHFLTQCSYDKALDYIRATPS
ncbi:MAG: hypothetical protein AAF585_06475 [Verrucomicrobiota bacterium]